MADEQREAGSWIGQNSDENTDDVRRQLDPDAERAAVTDNTARGPNDRPPPDAQPAGHREPGGGDE